MQQDLDVDLAYRGVPRLLPAENSKKKCQTDLEETSEVQKALWMDKVSVVPWTCICYQPSTVLLHVLIPSVLDHSTDLICGKHCVQFSACSAVCKVMLNKYILLIYFYSFDSPLSFTEIQLMNKSCIYSSFTLICRGYVPSAPGDTWNCRWYQTLCTLCFFFLYLHSYNKA